MITTEDVTIQKATVDIQVVRVGQRQMTLALFWQLPVKQLALFKDTLGLDNYFDEPWGYVKIKKNIKTVPDYYETWILYPEDGILYKSRGIDTYYGLEHWFRNHKRGEFPIELFIQHHELPQLFIGA